MHTSTVTVAVYRNAPKGEVTLDESDLQWSYFRGSGKGGQKRNKTESGVRVRHVPSGLVVRIESGRSLPQNKQRALDTLRARLAAQRRKRAKDQLDSHRKELVGSGMRGDKVRTIRVQDGVVTDHRSGAKLLLRDYLRGEWGELLTPLA